MSSQEQVHREMILPIAPKENIYKRTDVRVAMYCIITMALFTSSTAKEKVQNR